jgi:hypothetical protein
MFCGAREVVPWPSAGRPRKPLSCHESRPLSRACSLRSAAPSNAPSRIVCDHPALRCSAGEEPPFVAAVQAGIVPLLVKALQPSRSAPAASVCRFPNRVFVAYSLKPKALITPSLPDV